MNIGSMSMLILGQCQYWGNVNVNVMQYWGNVKDGITLLLQIKFISLYGKVTFLENFI